MNENQYDLIIIGGGSAAFAAANTANWLKKKTLLINYENILPFGGTCTNVGCMPSKSMLHQGKEYYYAIRSKFKSVQLEGKADFLEALKETRKMVKGRRANDYRKVIENKQYVDFKEGLASFTSPHTVKVEDEIFHGKNFLIATGAFAFVPPVKGIEQVDYLTSKSIFLDLNEKPDSIVILGGGFEAVEFSQIFHHFDIKVTVLQRSDRVLTKFDSVIAKELQKYLEEEGITIYTGTSLKEVKKTANGVEVTADIKGKGTKTIIAEKMLVSTGLTPNTDKIGIEYSGVELNRRGFVKVNQHMQTSQNHIYAAGDVTGLMPLKSTATKEGNIAALNMFENAKKTINYTEVPQAVFTSPEVASVGITEEEYMKEHDTCLCQTVTLDHVEKAVAINDTRGLIRMVVDPKTKVILGVHIVGPMAADVINTATYAIKNKMTVYDIQNIVHVFPTMTEMIKKAAQRFG